MKDSIFLEKLRYVHYPPTKYPRFEFNEDKCKHCKTCFLACPTSCIQWDEKKKIPYPTGLGKMELACLACNNCEAVCSAGAIRVRGEYRVLKGRYKTTDGRSEEMVFPMPFGGKDAGRGFTDFERDLTEVERVIYRRRSIRIFQDKPVPRKLIERIIEAAQWAPSGGNCKPWKIVVMADKKKIEKLDKECAKALNIISNIYKGSSWWRSILVPLISYIMVNKMDQRPIAALEKTKLSGGIICFGAPVVIHVLMDVRGIGDPLLDTGIACQNLVLAAHSLGLGTLYVGLIKNGLKYLPRRISEELGIIYPYAIATSICVGYPKGNLDNPVARTRCPVEWII